VFFLEAFRQLTDLSDSVGEVTQIGYFGCLDLLKMLQWHKMQNLIRLPHLKNKRYTRTTVGFDLGLFDGILT